MKSNLDSGPEQVLTDIALAFDFLRRNTIKLLHIHKSNLLFKSHDCSFVGFQLGPDINNAIKP